MIPDWLDICNDACNAGISWNRLSVLLGVIIMDSYGSEFRDNVLETLDRVHQIGLQRILALLERNK